MSEPSKAQMISRRAELLAELFLQELGAAFVARPNSDFGYDFFVGFHNANGGVDLTAVQVKATEGPIKERFSLSTRVFSRLYFTNLPTLLLVADVKRNRLFYGLPKSVDFSEYRNAKSVPIPITEIAEADKQDIRRRLGYLGQEQPEK